MILEEKNMHNKPTHTVDSAIIQHFKDLKTPDSAFYSEDIRFKEIVKQRLLQNKYIIHALNVDGCDEDEADRFFGDKILPYYLIKPVQVDVSCYICYETSFEELARYNDLIKMQQLTFYILSNCKGIIEKDSGIARHDLLAALLIEEFNWENFFGNTIHVVSNQSRAIDNDYVARTIVFESETTNSIVKNGRVMNNGRF